MAGSIFYPLAPGGVGDIVFTKVQEPKTKLSPRFEGPYRVIEVDDCNKIKIRHLTTNETKTAHLDPLKRHARSQGPFEDADPPSQVPPEANTPSSPTSEPTNESRKKLRSYKGDDKKT